MEMDVQTEAVIKLYRRINELVDAAKGAAHAGAMDPDDAIILEMNLRLAKASVFGGCIEFAVILAEGEK